MFITLHFLERADEYISVSQHGFALRPVADQIFLILHRALLVEVVEGFIPQCDRTLTGEFICQFVKCLEMTVVSSENWKDSIKDKAALMQLHWRQAIP